MIRARGLCRDAATSIAILLCCFDAVAEDITANQCSRIGSIVIADVHIQIAEWITAGGLEPPIAETSDDVWRTYRQLPDICRLVGIVNAGFPSAVSFEAWIPSGHWNGDSTGVPAKSWQDGSAAPFSSPEGTQPLGNALAVFGIHALERNAAADPAAQIAQVLREVSSRIAVAPTTQSGITHLDGRFSGLHAPVMNAGPGRIVGQITRNGRPATGVYIRLALDNLHWTVWGATNGDGNYTIAVPFGDYRIVGYQIDAWSGDIRLAGTIAREWGSVRVVTSVAGGRPGAGPDRHFVSDPVMLRYPLGNVTRDQARRIGWEAYPGALNYLVGIYEQAGISASRGRLVSFRGLNAPVSSTEIDLRDFGLELAAGAAYFIDIEALDERGNALSGPIDSPAERIFTIVD